MSSYYDFMTIKDLKDVIADLPDDMNIVIPVVDEDDVNKIFGFRLVRTAGILTCESEERSKVLCVNGAADDNDIADQVYYSGKDVGVDKILYGRDNMCAINRTNKEGETNG